MLYDTYLEMLQDNIQSVNCDDSEEVLSLVDFLANEAFKYNQLFNLIEKKLNEDYQIDINNVIKVKEVLDLPYIDLKRCCCEQSTNDNYYQEELFNLDLQVESEDRFNE